MINLDFTHIAYAFFYLFVFVLLSLFLKFKLERELLMAALRCTLQLFFLGFFLQWYFRKNGAEYFLAGFLFMLIISSFVVVRRLKNPYRKVLKNVSLALVISTSITGAYILFFTIPVEPWYRVSSSIPIIGMLVSNSLNGVILSLDRFLTDLKDHSGRIYSLLAIGANRFEACHQEMRTALKTAMTPIINSMLVVGLVGMPGMFTGQILAGGAPWSAALYQIIILIMIACSIYFASLIAILLTFFDFFNTSHQLLPLHDFEKKDGKQSCL